MATIKIPSQLRTQTNNKDMISVKGQNVQEALQDLISQFPSLKDKLFDEDEKIRRYVNIYLGDEDIRFLQFLETPIENNSELSLIPAIAGGSIT